MDFDLERWGRQCAEYDAILIELTEASRGEPVTAYQVSLEQRKRLLARGERMMFPPGRAVD